MHRSLIVNPLLFAMGTRAPARTSHARRRMDYYEQRMAADAQGRKNSRGVRKKDLRRREVSLEKRALEQKLAKLEVDIQETNALLRELQSMRKDLYRFANDHASINARKLHYKHNLLLDLGPYRSPHPSPDPTENANLPRIFKIQDRSPTAGPTRSPPRQRSAGLPQPPAALAAPSPNPQGLSGKDQAAATRSRTRSYSESELFGTPDKASAVEASNRQDASKPHPPPATASGPDSVDELFAELFGSSPEKPKEGDPPAARGAGPGAEVPRGRSVPEPVVRVSLSPTPSPPSATPPKHKRN